MKTVSVNFRNVYILELRFVKILNDNSIQNPN
jgi:hypothetical protein